MVTLRGVGEAMYFKLSLVLVGVFFWTGCGSSELDGTADKAGPTPEEILREQKGIAEYYEISYRAKYVANKQTGKIEQLIFASASLTDLGVDRIAKLTDLKTLNLVNTKITDEGLKHIGNLPNLRKLELGRNNITDAGMDHLVGLKKLEYLALNNTRVADKGLMKLSEMPRLNYLDLRRARVTPAGFDRFEKTPLGRKRGFRLMN